MQNIAEPTAGSETETTPCPLCRSSNDSIIHTFGELQVVACRDCGLRYLNPRIREADMKKRYEDGAYFSGDGTGYANYNIQEVSLRLTFRRFLHNIRKIVPQAESLLEVGCGYGFFLDEAKGFFSRLSGVELSSEAGMEARRVSGANVHIGDISTLPSGLKDFNIIVAINVMEHVYDPVPFVRSLHQRLAADGKFFVATPDIGSLWYKAMKKRWPSFKIPEHVTFYDKKTLADLLKRAGFRSVGSVPYPHAFPLGIIAEKFGISLPVKWSEKILWLPRVMVALYGNK